MTKKRISSLQNYDGEKWYSHDSIRAVNQAIGRVIRHKDDYGAIIFMDARFSDYRIQRLLSLWVRAHIKEYGPVSDLTNDLSDFFRTHNLKCHQNVSRPFHHKLVNLKTILNVEREGK